ncbi:hypothetical protein ACIP2X_18970 [Streptomyces sp. NPDC089424]|uniref:hypothetical protein n=1 Tax=Streptomyces sp. NPDC089424 TaxID=3365917 RepID=UPI00381D42D6
MNAPAEPFKALTSYAYFGKPAFTDLLDTLHAGPVMVFGDSGAHSARTLGLALTLDGYAAWCHEHDRRLTLYANLDVIGAPEATWRNQQALQERGLTPIPVFHTGEPWHFLERYLDEGHTYIALGKLLGNPLAELLPWLDTAFRLAQGRAVFHGFGMTTWEVLRRLPFYSVDSSKWLEGERFGVATLYDDRTGSWVRFLLRDKAAVLQHLDLIRSYGMDPRLLANRAIFTARRHEFTAAVAQSYRRAEADLRTRHGLVTLPDSPRNPITRHGTPSTPGLHIYLAGANQTVFTRAVNGVRGQA